MNLSQLAESDARREEAQLRVRHHAALIAGIVCRIRQGRTRIGPSVRQRPPRFSNITESVGCSHVPHQVVPGTFVEYAFLFFLFSASGGWVIIKLELPHLLPCIRYMCFDSTHAPVSTAARAAGTGLVSMSTRPDIPGMLHLEREARDWSTYNEYSYRIIRAKRVCN